MTRLSLIVLACITLSFILVAQAKSVSQLFLQQRAHAPVLNGTNLQSNPCCSYCGECSIPDRACCGFSSGDNQCYFCNNGAQCCNDGRSPLANSKCCASSATCCVNCANPEKRECMDPSQCCPSGHCCNGKCCPVGESCLNGRCCPDWKICDGECCSGECLEEDNKTMCAKPGTLEGWVVGIILAAFGLFFLLLAYCLCTFRNDAKQFRPADTYADPSYVAMDGGDAPPAEDDPNEITCGPCTRGWRRRNPTLAAIIQWPAGGLLRNYAVRLTIAFMSCFPIFPSILSMACCPTPRGAGWAKCCSYPAGMVLVAITCLLVAVWNAAAAISTAMSGATMVFASSSSTTTGNITTTTTSVSVSNNARCNIYMSFIMNLIFIAGIVFIIAIPFGICTNKDGMKVC